MSADTRPQGPAARGRLRIYLGCAPGAGTTCALLSEGRRRAKHGTDVAVASAETHGRPQLLEWVTTMNAAMQAMENVQYARRRWLILATVARPPYRK